MPTALPRLPVTLTAEQRDLLARVAKVNRCSQSKVIRDLLDTAAPVLLRVIAAMENVQKLDAEKAHLIRATLSDAQAEAEAMAATALALLERISAPPVAAQRAPEDDDPFDVISPPPRPRRPPTANRGGDK